MNVPGVVGGRDRRHRDDRRALRLASGLTDVHSSLLLSSFLVQGHTVHPGSYIQVLVIQVVHPVVPAQAGTCPPVEPARRSSAASL